MTFLSGVRSGRSIFLLSTNIVGIVTLLDCRNLMKCFFMLFSLSAKTPGRCDAALAQFSAA
mgnify:CR=1 FL=1